VEGTSDAVAAWEVVVARAEKGERRVERKFVDGSKGPIGGSENLARREWA
jgi:hypothetical protein